MCSVVLFVSGQTDGTQMEKTQRTLSHAMFPAPNMDFSIVALSVLLIHMQEFKCARVQKVQLFNTFAAPVSLGDHGSWMESAAHSRSCRYHRCCEETTDS